MTFAELKKIIRMVEPYVDGPECLGAGDNEIYIQVKNLPEQIAERLEDLNVSLESGILSSGGTLTLFV